MKKCVVVSDSFKGSLSSEKICEIAEKQIHAIFPQCEVTAIPMADGGEGTVNCLLHALGGKLVSARVHGPWMEEIDASYAVCGETAVIEMAAAAGLTLARQHLDPSHTTTFGVGELIGRALDGGAKRIILGLGGSATNDCGAGCAAALGVVFRDAEGREFVPTGHDLSCVASIDVSAAKKRLKGVSFTAICDVDNPTFGKNGAAYVFGPQKGANPMMVRTLDMELRAFCKTIERELGVDVSELRGAGAAGAMGAGLTAFLGAGLKPGVETVLDAIRFDEEVRGADLVLTGEGRIDAQSVMGKTVGGVARHAKKHSVPVVAVVGCTGEGSENICGEGVTAVFTTNRLGVPFPEAAERAAEDYARTLRGILKLIAAFSGGAERKG